MKNEDDRLSLLAEIIYLREMAHLNDEVIENIDTRRNENWDT